MNAWRKEESSEAVKSVSDVCIGCECAFLRFHVRHDQSLSTLAIGVIAEDPDPHSLAKQHQD